MKILSTEIELIDRYLDDRLNYTEACQFMDRMQTDAGFKRDVQAQTTLRTLIRMHYRHRLKRRFRELHRQLREDPARKPLRQAIDAIFKL